MSFYLLVLIHPPKNSLLESHDCGNKADQAMETSKIQSVRSIKISACNRPNFFECY